MYCWRKQANGNRGLRANRHIMGNIDRQLTAVPGYIEIQGPDTKTKPTVLPFPQK